MNQALGFLRAPDLLALSGFSILKQTRHDKGRISRVSTLTRHDVGEEAICYTLNRLLLYRSTNEASWMNTVQNENKWYVPCACVALTVEMIGESWVERVWKEAVLVKYMCCPGIYLERLRVTTKNLIQNVRCLGRDSNRRRTANESRALSRRQNIRL